MLEKKQALGTIVKNMKGKESPEKVKFSQVVRELKQKIAELEKMQSDIRLEASPVSDTRTLIEEIHVPALELLKEKKHND